MDAELARDLEHRAIKGKINEAANAIEQFLSDKGVPYGIGSAACLEVAAFAASESKDKDAFLAASGEMFDRGVKVREDVSEEIEMRESL